MKCKKCYHNCHCKEDLHADEYGLCTCDSCACKKDKDYYKFLSKFFKGKKI